MIYQKIEKDYKQMGYAEAIVRALDYLKNTDFLNMDAGVYEIEGKDLYAQVFDNTSKKKEDAKPEFHKDYLDIQYWPEGEELMGFAPIFDNPDIVEEHLERDLYFTTVPEKENFIKVEKGDYVVLYPSDVHRPGVAVDECITYRKVVIKLRASLLEK